MPDLVLSEGPFSSDFPIKIVLAFLPYAPHALPASLTVLGEEYKLVLVLPILLLRIQLLGIRGLWPAPSQN